MQIEAKRDSFPASVIEQDLRVRLAAFPYDAHSWYLLGCHLMREHRLKEACVALETAVRLSPDARIFRIKLASLYDAIGQNELV